jgi:hypothetical protein
MTHRVLSILFIIIAQTISQDIRTLELSIMDNTKYQCVDSGCSPSTIIPGSYLRGCQIDCLSQSNCRTVTFDQSSNQCELFVDRASQRGNMLTQTGVLTMIAIDARELSTCKYYQ